MINKGPRAVTCGAYFFLLDFLESFWYNIGKEGEERGHYSGVES